MKKGLSVLLIAAALFGFYGGAVNLQDVLACMHYWEKEGEKSTADMNKLEDGLKQLQDNEQAYLDGADQLAEGEKTLADGEAQYAQGLKDYAAAPGKLAAGQAQLDEGYDSYSDLKKLIRGLNEAHAHGTKTTGGHDKYWHDGFTFNTYKQNGKAGLKPGRELIVQTLNSQKDTVALLESLTGASGLVDSATNASSYKNFDDVVNKKLYPTFSSAAGLLNTFAGIATQNATTLQSALDGYNGLLKLEGSWDAIRAQIQAGYGYDIGECTAKNEESFVKSDFCPSAYKALSAAFAGMSQSGYYAYAKASALLRGGVASNMSDFLSGKYGTTLKGIAAKADGSGGLADKVAALVKGMTALSPTGGADASTFAYVMPQVIDGLNEAAGLLKQYAATAQESADTFKAWDVGYNTLLDGQKTLGNTSSGLPYAFKQMVTNKTIKAAVKQYDPGLMSLLKKYTGSTLKSEDMGKFDDDLVYISKKVIPRAQSVLAKVKSSAAKQLADGEKQLAQGKKDYAAAPAKLADAERQLADGRKQLADGKEQLGQYEDGEQQVRDGLATLMSTEPSGGLESILDRRNGDDDFDNGDEHLELAEGLDAVDVGRGYQADSGELITAELVKRGAGTAAGIAAGVIALLAALLSFLKKNKGAAISACIAAIAAAGGAAVGTSAGTEFSAQAGSVVGVLPWAAAGVLAAVAIVFAVVHFSNPAKAAK